VAKIVVVDRRQRSALGDGFADREGGVGHRAILHPQERKLLAAPGGAGGGKETVWLLSRRRGVWRRAGILEPADPEFQ
jgi:hypothetical protein